MAQAIQVSLPVYIETRADRIRRGRYSLAPRSTLELESYLQDEFGDLMYKCARCNKHVLNVSYRNLLVVCKS